MDKNKSSTPEWAGEKMEIISLCQLRFPVENDPDAGD